MTWEIIGRLGQVLGPIGVVISLIYLAIQIRKRKRQSRNLAMNALVTHFSELMSSQVEAPDLCDLWLRGLQSFDELDGPSKLRFAAHLERKLRAADSLYLQFLDGALKTRRWRWFDRAIADVAAYPGFQKWWLTRKHWYSDELCRLIDKHIKISKPGL
jgi:hypothetical protein